MREEGICYLGSMKVKGSVQVTDPCYGTDTEIEGLRPGNWIAVTQLRKEDNWGVRNCYLAIFHEHYNYDHTKFDLVDETGGDAGVDSGQMSIYASHRDYCIKDDYEEVCEITNSDVGGGPIMKDEVYGFVTSSGFGDGGYPIFVKRDDITGEVLAIEVVFIPLERDSRYPSSEDYENDDE